MQWDLIFKIVGNFFFLCLPYSNILRPIYMASCSITFAIHCFDACFLKTTILGIILSECSIKLKSFFNIFRKWNILLPGYLATFVRWFVFYFSPFVVHYNVFWFWFKPFNASTFNSGFKQHENKHVTQSFALGFFMLKCTCYRKQQTKIVFYFLPNIDCIAILKIQA